MKKLELGLGNYGNPHIELCVDLKNEAGIFGARNRWLLKELTGSNRFSSKFGFNGFFPDEEGFF
jgi:hypothetical protein